MLAIYIVISILNVFLHIVRSILVIKSGKLVASLANCICYTFSAVVIKFISEVDLWIAITVQATTNFVGCYLAMWFCEKILSKIRPQFNKDGVFFPPEGGRKAARPPKGNLTDHEGKTN